MEEDYAYVPTDLYTALKEMSKMFTNFVDYDDEGNVMFFDGTTQDIEFNFETKSIYAKDYVIMMNGELIRCCIELGTGTKFDLTGLLSQEVGDKEPYAFIEQLYDDYYHSIPSTKEKQVQHYFKALTADEIGLDEINKGINRTEARVALEGYVLLASVLGLIPWENDNYFYWASQKEDGLVLYKKWIA